MGENPPDSFMHFLELIVISGSGVLQPKKKEGKIKHMGYVFEVNAEHHASIVARSSVRQSNLIFIF
jgi:hypothetical protein